MVDSIIIIYNLFIIFSVDYLQNADILRQYIARLSLLGWKTRQEFEEIWMCLLQVLTISKDDLSDDEVIALSESSTLIIHGITQLLLHTMKQPNCGQTIHSLPIHSPRSIRSSFYETVRGKQLKVIEDLIQKRLSSNKNCGAILGSLQEQLLVASNSNMNLERVHASNNYSSFNTVNLAPDLKHLKFHHRFGYASYSIGQVDISYILNSIHDNLNKDVRYSGMKHKTENKDMNETEKNGASICCISYRLREASLSANGLDLTVRSCMHLLIQTIYSQWLLPTRYVAYSY